MRTFFLMLLGIVPLFAQNNGIDQPSDFVMPPTGGEFLRWHGKPGRTYFVQASSQAEPLQKWNWAPIIETGNNQDISHEVFSSAPRGFFRLKYTDDPIPTGKTPETADFDGDELDNYSEITSNPQTDPLNNDTDGDGLSDGLEVLYLLSDPTNQDSDGDGMPDQWEYWNGLNLILDDAADDADLDGLTNLEEFDLGTSPYSSDTDYDNLPDGWEAINGLNPTDWNDATADSDADGVRNLEEYVLDFNPQSPTTQGVLDLTRDRDGDGMPDFWEALYGKWVGGNFSRTLDWDVADGAADLDKDGLTNLEEFNQGTKPNNFDSDGDNLPDKWEITYNIDPKISTEANGAAGDIEPDGVTNFDEFLHGTNPNLADTDGDGASDLVEITQGSDPNDSTDAGTPPDDPLEDVVFKVGGDYASWRMEIQGMGPKDHRKLVVVSPKYNEWETKSHKLRKNNRYEVTLHHTGSKDDPDAPWYCWEARVEDKPTQQTFENYSPDRVQGVAEFFAISNGSWIVDNRDGLFTAHNHRYEQSGGNVAAFLKAKLIPAEIIPDYNRDGKIDQADRGKITATNPWRFWINDDDDSGETSGTDIPQGTAANDTNGKNAQADGLRDLVDFFPLRVDIKEVLPIFPSIQYRYRLTHPATTEDPLLRVILAPMLHPSSSGDVLKSLPIARARQNDESRPIHETGPLLDESFLIACAADNGLLLVESVKPTTSPIVLKIERISDGKVVGEILFHLKTTSVMDMLRYKFVMPGATDLNQGDIPSDPPNWPDLGRNDKHFVFVHGYNVNDTQSKGWGAEVFKRMFWSGSNAKFSVFAWRGYQSQTGPLTPDYQINLENAFNTAKSLKQFIDLLPGEKSVAAHSMGNILMGAAMHDWGARPANYFMLDSAAAKECYDKNEAEDSNQDARMVHPAWKDYPKQLRASEWHRLIPPAAWPASDWRGKLTWKDRLKGVIENGGQTQVYNFYSTGEEVLNNPETNNPVAPATAPFSTPFITWTQANKMWAMQEKLKGHGLLGFVFTSTYGGWKPNLVPFTDSIHTIAPPVPDEQGHRMKTPAELPALLDSSNYSNEEQAFLLARSTIPFFDDSADSALFEGQNGTNSPGSNYAYANRHKLIAEMIPCTTFATGRNAFLYKLHDNPNTTENEERNIDMNTTMKTDPTEWPLSNANQNEAFSNNPDSRPWLHSDIREKAFSHNWKAYAKFIEIGNLNQTN